MGRYVAWFMMVLVMVPIAGTDRQDATPITAEPYVQDLCTQGDDDACPDFTKGFFYGASVRVPVKLGSFREGLLTSRAGIEALMLPWRAVGFSASLRPFSAATFTEVSDWVTGDNRIIMIVPASAGVRWYPFNGPRGLSVQLQWEAMVVTQDVDEGWLFTFHQGIGVEAAYSLLFSESLVYLSAQLSYMPQTPLGSYHPAVGIGILW